MDLTTNVICPLVCVLGYTYLANPQNLYTVDYWTINSGFIYIPMLRAFVGLSLGVIIYHPIIRCCDIMTQKNALLLDFISVFALLLLLKFKNLGYIHLIFIPLFITVLNNTKSIFYKLFNRSLFKSCGKISFTIYLSQALIIPIFNTYYYQINFPFSSELFMILIFCIIITSYSYIFTKVVDFILIKYKEKKYNKP